MDISLNSVDTCEISSLIKTEANVETDIIVPDTKPDIQRILSVTAFADTTDRSVKKDKVILSGNVKFNILYSGEHDPLKIVSVDYVAPFSHQVDFTGIDEECLTVCSWDISKTSFEVKNSRKLTAGALVNYELKSSKIKEKNIVSVSDELTGYPYRKTTEECDCLIASKDIDFELKETFTIPCREDADIYRVNAGVEISDIKAVNNKAVIKGQVNIKALYESNGEISDYSTEISFTEVCDIDNLSSEQRLVYDFEVADMDYNADFSDMGKTIESQIKINGYICAYEHREVSFINDIYSPDYTYEKLCENISCEKLSEFMHTRDTVKDSVELSLGMQGIDKIYHMDCTAGKTQASLEGSCLKLKGTIEMNLIYADEDNNLCKASKTSPYEFEFIYQDNHAEDYNIISNVKCVNCGYVLGSANEIQLRAVMSAKAAVLSRKSYNAVTGFNVDTNNPIQKDSQASIVVFYPHSSSDLWEVAKKYNTTCEEIAKINSLDLSVALVNDKPILIPKRHI